MELSDFQRQAAEQHAVRPPFATSGLIRSNQADQADYAHRLTAIHKAIDAAAHITACTQKDVVDLTMFFYAFMTPNQQKAKEDA
jgi:hypothetical protein